MPNSLTSADGRRAPEVRHYIGGGYYLLVDKVVELGCDSWPDDEAVLMEGMLPEDGLIFVAAMKERANVRTE